VRENEIHVDDLIHFATNLVGTPYLWAGKSRVGFDCSGLVTFTTRALGFPEKCIVCGEDWLTMHNAQRLHDCLRPVPIVDAKRGHLVFYGSDAKHIYHVGILAGGELMLEAGGGDHTCTSVEEARRRGARVRESKSWRWKNLQGVRALPMIYP
jgi:cell wall-associated NlpC family hydrolase